MVRTYQFTRRYCANGQTVIETRLIWTEARIWSYFKVLGFWIDLEEPETL